MKSRIFKMILIGVLAFCRFVHAANDFSGKKTAESPPLVQPSREIPLGEHLFYEVSWMGVPVGVGEIEVKEKTTLDKEEVYHVVAKAGTNDFLSKIYPVHDEVHSWIQAKTLHSVRFEKKVSEGTYQASERVVYDAAQKKGYYESLTNGSKKDFDILVPVHDVISAFYWVRRQGLVPGQSLKSTVNSGEKDYELEVDILGREQKELRRRGMVDVILVEPKTSLKGIMEKRGRVWIYLKNNQDRVPMVITFKTPFGPVVGVLKERR